MSYRYGLNGNDLNWDSMMFLKSFVMELERAIFDGEIELDEDGYIPDDVYEGYMDGNPTVVYYKADEDIDMQKVLEERKSLDNYLDWYIVHDTNGNFVSLTGDVPDEYLTEDYIQERNEELGDDEK